MLTKIKTVVRRAAGRHRRRVVITSLIIVAIAVAHLSFPLHPKRHRQEATIVAVSTVAQHDVNITTTTVGSVIPHASVAIKSLVDGQIINVLFKEGDFVTKGQTLFVIDQRPFMVKLEQAKANLAHDQAQLDVTSLAVTRNSKLVTQGYIAKQDFDQLKANQTALLASVQADQAAVKAAELELNYCTITAPIDGRAGSVLVTTGNLVKANDQNPLVILNQIVPIDAQFAISEKQLRPLNEYRKQGDITIIAYLEQSATVTKTGILSFIDNTINTDTGMITLKASFANQDQFFWPGQFVHIVLPLGKLSQAITIPTRAIQMGQNGPYVFLVNKNHGVKITPVTLGANIANETVITKGLQPGELVVTEGQLNLNDGSKVRWDEATNK